MSTMKKSLFLLGVLAATAGHAQNSNVVSAYNYLTDGNLAKAVEYIEPAITNEGTMGKEKTWRYRGDIYRSIALGDKPELLARFPDAMQKAIDSYIKANELDTKGSYKEDNLKALSALQVQALNGGNDAFTAKDYDKAIALYGESERVAKTFGQVDSNAVFNRTLAYESKGDLKKAIEGYQECIRIGYDKSEVFRYLASLQKKEGDLNAAIATTQAGHKRHPNDKEIMLDEVAYLLEANRMEEAETSVKAAIEKDPTNPVLHSVLGSLYDAKANPKEGTVPEADMIKWYDLAEGAYKKSIEVDPKFFDGYYNIGVLYNNRAAYEYDKCAKIKDDAAYAKCKKVADDIYLKTIPYFEKAYELRPDDKSVMQQLKKLYAKTGNSAKFDEMKKLLGE
ncbi:MAG: hypothetical protein JST66_10500 [Bacteroidetes bacterium]|nr:hypothetical protein [Bacteroidota bacterium]